MANLRIDPTTITVLPEQFRPASTVRMPQTVGLDNKLIGYMTLSPDGRVTCQPVVEVSGSWVIDTESIPT